MFIPCTCDDESVCIDCNLKESLNCRYDKELVACFRNRHLPYRVVAFLVVGVASFFTGLWWMFWIFALVTVLNFTVIETLYLCRHCPFYFEEGKTVHCITLKGIPRVWRYDPSPISRNERIGMLAVGGFIDLFPVIAGGYASWVMFSTAADSLLLLTMIGLTVIALIAAGYLGKFLADNYCARCVNLSCAMNKVPKAVAEEYLDRNPHMREIWNASGYELRNE